MEFMCVYLFLAVLATAACSPLPAEKRRNNNVQTKYTTKYDYIDVDSILRSNRLLKNYMECVMDRGPCTREGLELKKNIPEALETDCLKCSERQKQMAGKVMAYLLQYKRNYWDELLAKYDPKGRFRSRFGLDQDDEDNEDYIE